MGIAAGNNLADGDVSDTIGRGDEGDGDAVLDDDDPGAIGETVIVVEGGCTQVRTPGLIPFLALGLLRRRRRRS